MGGSCFFRATHGLESAALPSGFFGARRGASFKCAFVEFWGPWLSDAVFWDIVDVFCGDAETLPILLGAATG